MYVDNVVLNRQANQLCSMIYNHNQIQKCVTTAIMVHGCHSYRLAVNHQMQS